MFKENNKKMDQRLKKIWFSILFALGLIGLSFGISVFLILGNETKYEADTQSTSVKVKKVDSVDAKTSPAKETVKLLSVTKPATEPTHQAESKPVPAPAPSETENTDSVTYTIATGDSLSAISEKFGTAIRSIMQQNKIENAQDIAAGQVLHFSKSYVVKEESPAPVVAKVDNNVVAQPQATSQTPQSQPAVSVDNGNKVVAGGLSKEERTYVLTQLQSRTGVPASQWDYIISRESGWMLTIKNSLGYYGLFQLSPGYRGYDGGIDEQIEGAIYLFNHGGMAHWSL